MNVNDQWMLERMQQMAANMASSLPQTSQDTDTAKTEQGDSFQDMMNKAKDQKVDTASKKDTSATKTESVQDKAPAQKTEHKVITNMKDPRIQALDPATQAQIAAGFTTALEGADGSLILTDTMEPRAIIIPTLPNGEIDWTKPFVITNSKGEQFEVYLDPQNGDHQLFQVSADGGRTQLDLFPEQPKFDFLDALKGLDMTAVTSESKVTTLREAVSEITTEGAAEEQDDTANLNAESMTASQPLFQDVKATPVKVGENFQLDTQEPDMDANLADAIRFADQQGLRQIEIKLNPENLGSLTVKLTQATDGSLQVVLHAANAKAANLLSQHMDGLNAALQGYSQDREVRVEVQRGESGQQAQQQQTDPDGRNQQQQQQQQQHQQEDQHSGDFIQRLRLGLFGEAL